MNSRRLLISPTAKKLYLQYKAATTQEEYDRLERELHKALALKPWVRPFPPEVLAALDQATGF
jgi:hypothetical protein